MMNENQERYLLELAAALECEHIRALEAFADKGKYYSLHDLRVFDFVKTEISVEEARDFQEQGILEVLDYREYDSAIKVTAHGWRVIASLQNEEVHDGL